MKDKELKEYIEQLKIKALTKRLSATEGDERLLALASVCSDRNLRARLTASQNLEARRAIDDFVNGGKFAAAAKVAKNVGLMEEAIDYYEKAGDFCEAGYIALSLGGIDGRHDYNMTMRAIENYIKTGAIRKAADIAHETGRTELASELYKRCKK